MGSARFDHIPDIARHRGDAIISCTCGHKKYVTGQEIVKMFGASLIRDAEKRLRCVVCKEKGARITPVPAAR